MIKILIDGQALDIDQATEIAITYAIADITNPSNSSSGFSKTVEVPYTPTNLAIMQYTNEVFSREQFNNELHTAEIIVDDNSVMTGVATLEKCTTRYWNPRSQQKGMFHITIVGSAYEWFSALNTQLNKLSSNEVVNYTLPNVYANSVDTSASLIKFFPIDKGAFYLKDDDTYTPRDFLDLNDYHPFINVWKALELILGGFKIESSLSTLFQKLYFAGTIVEDENMPYIKRDNDFIIKLDAEGLNFADPSTPKDCSSLYKWGTNDYFVATDGIVYTSDDAAYFKPTATCTVQFSLSLTYTAQIASGGAYMDTLTFGPGEEVFVFTPLDSAEAASAFSTASSMENGNYYFICLIFEDVSIYEGMDVCTIIIENEGQGSISSEYRVLYQGISKQAEYIYVYMTTATIDSSPVILRQGTSQADYQYLNVENLEDVTMTIVPVENEDTLDFSTTITSVSYRCTEGQSTKLLTAMSSSFGYGSHENGKITLGSLDGLGVCELYPTFGSSLAYGTDVSISEIGGTDTQLDLLKSLRSMYNLMFYTNALTRTIYIEPRTSFYELDRSKIVDWRGKIDYSNEIEIVELGEDTGASLHLNYGKTNDVIDYYNWKNNTEVGGHTEQLLNKISSEANKEISVSMFAPFLKRDVDSVGMELPQDKTETEKGEIGDADVNITPIIGYFASVDSRYCGSDLAQYPKYPALTFQDVGGGINLGFDTVSLPSITIIGKPSISRTVQGLKKYYSHNFMAYNYGRLITLYVKLEPHDIESLAYPRDDAHRDLRSVYLLEIDGEVIPCTLEKISDYQPTSGGSTKCTFLSNPNLELKDAGLTVITYNDTAISQDEDTLIGY